MHVLQLSFYPFLFFLSGLRVCLFAGISFLYVNNHNNKKNTIHKTIKTVQRTIVTR